MTEIVLVLLALMVFYRFFGPHHYSSDENFLSDDIRIWRESPEGLRERARYCAQRLMDGRGSRRQQRQDWLLVQKALKAGWEFSDLYISRDQYRVIRNYMLNQR